MHYRQVIVNLAVHVSREKITSIYGTTMNDTFFYSVTPTFSAQLTHAQSIACVLHFFLGASPQ